MSSAANLPVTPPSYLDGNKCLRDLYTDDDCTSLIAEVSLKDWPNLYILANAAYHAAKTAAHAHRKLLYAFFKASESENTALAQYALNIHQALSRKASARAFADIYNKKSLEEKKEERAERRARKKRRMDEDEAEAVESAASAAFVASLKIAERRLRQLADEAPSADQDLPAPQGQFDKYLNLTSDDENGQQNRAKWCRGTFYTPPPDCSPTIPLRSSECASSSSQQSSQEQEVPDQFGWVKAGDNWKNVYINETVPERPY